MRDSIFVVNAGSSSIKFQLFSVDDDDRLERRLKGQMDGIGSRPRLVAKGEDGKSLVDRTWQAGEVSGVPAALDKVVEFLREVSGGRLPSAVGHRVVHGGPDYSSPVAIDADVLRRLEQLTPLAPLHQPNNLAPIRMLLDRQPRLLQVACFDTAFHRGHPELADRYAIPEDLYREGVRRYGFHGLSYEYVAERLRHVAPDLASKKVIVAHLGSGASMCALDAGRSVESTMGFTALDGLPMGTRPGQLDPGVVLYLMSEKRMSAEAISELLYKKCGLKGLSGISNDVRELLASSDPRARLALDYFTYRIGLLAGMLAAAMQGLDGLVFTAGVGENAPAVREAVARRLAWLGLDLDPAANAAGKGCISRPRVPDRLLRDPDRRRADDRTPHAPRAARTRRPAHEGERSMIDVSKLTLLKGKKALVTGIANDQSIAWGCAKAFHAFGADVAVTYLNDKTRTYVEPLAREIDASLLLPLDLTKEGQLEAVFDTISKKWGRLDLCLHSIAFAPKEDLQGRVVDCSKKGFLVAMELSCWSFMRMAKLAEPLMKDGGALFTMTYYGSQMVVEHYNMMGPVKAALEVGDTLHGRRARTQGHPRARHLAGTPEDPGGVWHRRVRLAPAQGGGEGTEPQPRLHR